MDADTVQRLLRSLDERIERKRAEADQLAANFKAAFAEAETLKIRRADLQVEADAAAVEMRRYNEESHEAWDDDQRAEAKRLAELSDLNETTARGLNAKVKEHSAQIKQLLDKAHKGKDDCEQLNKEVGTLLRARHELDRDLRRCTENPRYRLVKKDTSGNVVSVLSRRGNLTWEKDPAGDVIGLSVHRGNLTFHYDAGLNPSGWSVRKGDITEHYDATGEPVGRSVHYKDHTEHFDASRKPTGTTRYA
jgi:hypothetical protein